MAFKDLQHYIKKLKQMGELKEINCKVSPYLEITEITDRVSKQYGPGLLFVDVEHSDYPVLINAMGTYERMSAALGVHSLDEIADEIEAYLNLSNYLSIRGLWKLKSRLLRLLYVFPIRLPMIWFRSQCQEVIEKNPNLYTLPVLTCWPKDAGPFFTLPLVFTKDLNTRQQNVGMYRMQVLDETTTGMHWHKHKDGSVIFEGYKKAKRRMPVSVALGCDPAVTYAATAPLPKQIDEIMLAGWLRKRNIAMVKSVTNNIYVPANAEIILEGYVDPEEDLVLEGPFGDHTGYYSLADYYPKFHVTCITHRKGAVYPATVVGKPPMEDCYMAKATERIFLPVLKLSIPELVNLNLPLEGVFHNCAIVSVKNHYPGSARKVMHAVWGMGQMMYTKMILVVDESVDPYDLKSVFSKVHRNCRCEEDYIINKGPLDALDHSSNAALYGSRLGIDATKKEAKDSIQQKNQAFYQTVFVKKEHPFQGMEEVIREMKNGQAKFTIALDHDLEPKDEKTILWKLFNNIDAARDLVFMEDRVGIDATRKQKEEGLFREWPDDIVMSQEIKDKVTKRWEEYGF